MYIRYLRDEIDETHEYYLDILEEIAASEQAGGGYGIGDAYCDGMTVVGRVAQAVDVTLTHDPVSEAGMDGVDGVILGLSHRCINDAAGRLLNYVVPG